MSPIVGYGTMTLYNAVIRFFRIVVQLYFIEVTASGRRHLPDEGPLMLAANHPSSILDSIVLSTQTPRPIRYIARSGLFRFPVVAWLFRQLGAIPVYRPGEAQDHTGRNLEVFERVFRVLERGGCVGIFPEGRNSPWAQVGPLRKGAARMALGAEARNEYALGLKIVPVGVNFESRELFMSAVLLRFGPAITVADYAELHRADPERAVRALTEDVQRALRRQALHIEDRRLQELVADLAEAFGYQLTADLESGKRDDEAPPGALGRWMWKLLAWYHRSSPEAGKALESRVQGRQHISGVLTWAAEHEPRRVTALRNDVDRYKDHLGQARLRRALAHPLDQPVRERLIRLQMTLYAVVMAPVALFGLAHNAVPYLFTKSIARLFSDQAIRGFAYFGIGVTAFTATYALFGYWLWRATDLSLPWTLTYLAVLPPTGFAALGYRRAILVYRDKILVRTLVWDKRQLVELLRRERELIFARFRALANRHGS